MSEQRMTSERWRRVMAVFHPAMERPSEERAAFVAMECGHDADLRREVDSLLAAAATDDAFLETPAADAVLAAPAGEIGKRVEVALGAHVRVERELSGGGMSRVFLVADTRLGRRVVVKVLPAALGASLDVERFHREVRVAASLRHPHIVPLLDAGDSADGLVYYTMPYIEGESLRRRLDREGALSPAEVVRIVREVADALAYAHGRGIVHRDVKPGNVLVDGEHVVVADFGIAKAVMAGVEIGDRRSAIGARHSERSSAIAPGHSERSEESGADRPWPDDRRPPSAGSLTMRSAIIGTPGYMSPEQARGDTDVDGRSDVFSLGCLAFELLTGERPLATRLDDGPRVVLTGAVERVITRAISPQPGDRFATTTAFAEALSAALGTADERLTSWLARWRVPLAVAAVGVVAAVVWLVPRSGDRTPTGVETRPMIAVLPFENLGRAEDGYFAIGVADELTTRLGSLHQLRVISRTSTRQYGGTTRSLRDVGRELGADYLLAGTVQWERPDSGRGRVRVRPRLVKVSDDSEIWSDRFDAQVVDVFAVQGAISERVAAALEVAVPGGERTALVSRPTNDFEAYTYFLRAEEIGRVPDASERSRAIALYDSALLRDPRFALALAKRSLLNAGAFRGFVDHSSARLERARRDAEGAVAISATLPEAQLALGQYYADVRDWARALDHFGQGLAEHPDHPELLAARGNALARMGKMREAAQLLEHAALLDPRSSGTAREVSHVYTLMRDYPSAERYLQRAIAIDPGAALVYAELARLQMKWKGDLDAAARVVREAPQQVSRAEIAARLCYEAPLAIPAGALWDSVVTQLTAQNFGAGVGDYMLCKAYWYRLRGSSALVRVYADSARHAFELAVRDLPEQDGSLALLAGAQALRGRADEARRNAARAVERLPITDDAHDGPWVLQNQAEVLVLLGDYEAAISVLARLLDAPSEISAAFLRVHPHYAPLRGNPQFEALIARE